LTGQPIIAATKAAVAAGELKLDAGSSPTNDQSRRQYERNLVGVFYSGSAALRFF